MNGMNGLMSMHVTEMSSGRITRKKLILFLLKTVEVAPAFAMMNIVYTGRMMPLRKKYGVCIMKKTASEIRSQCSGVE